MASPGLTILPESMREICGQMQASRESALPDSAVVMKDDGSVKSTRLPREPRHLVQVQPDERVDVWCAKLECFRRTFSACWT